MIYKIIFYQTYVLGSPNIWYYRELLKEIVNRYCYLNPDVFQIYFELGTSYTMGCLPVREDNPRALASGLSYVQADNLWYNYFIPPTSVLTLHINSYSC